MPARPPLSILEGGWFRQFALQNSCLVKEENRCVIPTLLPDPAWLEMRSQVLMFLWQVKHSQGGTQLLHGGRGDRPANPQPRSSQWRSHSPPSGSGHVGVCTPLISASAGGPKAPETHVPCSFLPGPSLWASCHSFRGQPASDRAVTCLFCETVSSSSLEKLCGSDAMSACSSHQNPKPLA